MHNYFSQASRDARAAAKGAQDAADTTHAEAGDRSDARDQRIIQDLLAKTESGVVAWREGNARVNGVRMELLSNRHSSAPFLLVRGSSGISKLILQGEHGRKLMRIIQQQK
jgi:hypothetical protein